MAAIFYTSGTTGRPKGACLTDAAILGSLGPGVLWPAALHRDEAVIGLPVAHIMGFVVLAGLAVAGVPVHMLPKFDPVAVLDAIERRRCTLFVGVPMLLREIGKQHLAHQGRTLRLADHQNAIDNQRAVDFLIDQLEM